MPGLTPDDEWMYVSVHAPRQVVNAVLAMLQREHGFQDISPIDWCVLERAQDFSHVTYSPADVPGNQYVIDWRRGEERGDVIVCLPRPRHPPEAERDS